MKAKRRGVLLVVAGPSGVGKGTLIDKVLARHPEVQLSISCTTRAPRPEETNGVQYHFVSATEFARMRDAGELLEWAEVYPGIFYGTPRIPAAHALEAGQDVILEIDDQGAQLVRQVLGDQAVLVFIAPPTFADLRSRLAGRKTESPEELRTRLTTARQEIRHMGSYDYLIVNDQAELAADCLEAILLAERVSLRVSAWPALQSELLKQAEVDGVTEND